MSKKYLRVAVVAERYGTTIRNIQRMAKENRFPKPVYLGHRYPLWDEEVLDEHDRATVVSSWPQRGRGRPRKDRAQADAATGEAL